MALTEDVPATSTHACPRCHQDVTEAWYGPCVTCRDALRASLGGERRTVDVGDYEPKMNVTPNAVAAKD